MNHRLTLSTIVMLVLPPLLWAGNSVVGRAVYDMVPPMTLNFLRWVVAGLILLPFGYQIFQRGSGLLSNWRRYALLGLLGVGSYNSLQYLALHTSSAVNVTLVASSMPVWMLMVLGWKIELLGKLLKRDVPLSRYKIRSLKPLWPFDGIKAREVLGWAPRVGTGEGLRRTFQGGS